MKYGIILSLLLVLTGCETAYNVTYALLSEKTEKDLTNKDGISIVDCYGKTMGEKHRAPPVLERKQSAQRHHRICL